MPKIASRRDDTLIDDERRQVVWNEMKSIIDSANNVQWYAKNYGRKKKKNESLAAHKQKTSLEETALA
jgi:hypothetical protein